MNRIILIVFVGAFSVLNSVEAAFDINRWFQEPQSTPVTMSRSGDKVVWVVEDQSIQLIVQNLSDQETPSIQIKLSDQQRLVAVALYEEEHLIYAVAEGESFRLIHFNLKTEQRKLLVRGKGKFRLVSNHQQTFPILYQVDHQAFAFSMSDGLVSETFELPKNSTITHVSRGQPCAAISNAGVLYQFREKNWYQVDGIEPIRKIEVDQYCDTIWVMSEGNADRVGIWQVRFDEKSKSYATDLFWSDNAYDLHDFVLSADKNKVAMAFYDGLYPETKTFDRTLSSVASLIRKLDRHMAWRAIASNEGGSKWLIEAQSPTQAPSIYLIDIKARKATLLRQRLRNQKLADQEVPEQKLADQKRSDAKKTWQPVEAVSLKLSGNLFLTSYITTPANLSTQTPVILKLHGGPFEIRDRWRFDPEAQWLAQQGYLVATLNYRGSAGFGEAFQRSAYGQLRSTIEDDVDQLFDFLEDQYAISRNNSCFLGASFGGFAALSELLENPADYKCGILMAPAIDLAGIYEKLQSPYDQEKFKSNFGDPDNPEWRRKHNLNLEIAELKRPLLVIYSSSDELIPVQQVDALINQLDKFKQSYETVKFEGVDHQMSGVDVREKIYREIGRFLERSFTTQR
ncbi:alpha/beta hydrolase family protein [Pleionea litopenaei]|uniref:YqiA/YcfP family alpha/beta fold hydrolase n=1 Tax=Pleionea litopenaei TaxID=3070815 RepID=A0AA51X808_9GAMM|nr:prolyl oligopeptidase family serine peptidase [Pleionea sp. HL-JVS1]WMS88882.1 YqiA/YcfP family alpha/beta fold hydrolase [Pleionea sp. HL-JVS1]